MDYVTFEWSSSIVGGQFESDSMGCVEDLAAMRSVDQSYEEMMEKRDSDTLHPCTLPLFISVLLESAITIKMPRWIDSDKINKKKAT